MPTLTIDGHSLTLRDLADVAIQRRSVTLAPEALVPIQASREWVEGAVQDVSRAVYGINTGFGSLARVRIPVAQTHLLSRNLIRSHAAGTGQPVPREVARAMVLLRANALAKGASGCRPVLIQRLLDLLNRGVDPWIPSQGSCGSSGDLAPLSHLGLLIAHHPDDPASETGAAWVGEALTDGRSALAEVGLEPLTLEAKEGLALNNGAQLSTAFTALALHSAWETIAVAEVAAAMSIEALHGVSRAFHPSVHALRPYPGARTCAANLLALLAGSALIDSDPHKVQDAYSLRCTPVVVGAARDALTHISAQLHIELNAATDNPVILLDALAQGGVPAYSAGLFHGEPVGMVADYLKIAIAEVANLSERRLYRLLTQRLSAALPAALSGPDDLGLGLQSLQTTAASLVSENKALAWPASVDSIPTCEDQEDHVAMSTTAARRAYEVAQNCQVVVAIELCCAARALHLRQAASPSPLKLGVGTSAALEALAHPHRGTPAEQLEHTSLHWAAVLKAVRHTLGHD